jgi:hypothetical protein
MDNNCKNCGATISLDSKICSYCGSVQKVTETAHGVEKPLKNALDEIKSYVDPASTYKSSENSIKPMAYDGQNQYESGNSNKVWIVIGVVVLVVWIIAIS